MTKPAPWDDGEISVTIKHDGKYGDPWIVFRGANPAKIKEQLIAFFELDDVSDEASAADVAYQANAAATRGYALSQELGATRIDNPDNKLRTTTKAKTEPKADKPAAESKADGDDAEILDITDLIKNADTVDAVKRVYAENKSAFDANADLLATYKARGKELSAK